mmetsp:Transcript_17009/g.47090  ORF Transcript_17009/g.47090 Transcript_17009/m.47090 type:complete len:211 (-) Transcript_17009:106-738(-)|eukprot:CAMPEP_0198117448 /NCGR_PEP_ID=MMETSP1442-20131203/18126_1 /TAXON_ID= /ORGANISM="Craspedostauros australis, Strain CCMP3328" /LENGTH=210 /DNA_ID=CAMNT_0043775499 /DNA_START=291 /DNA_END=923 /DNA_ORIENTATION=+
MDDNTIISSSNDDDASQANQVSNRKGEVALGRPIHRKFPINHHIPTEDDSSEYEDLNDRLTVESSLGKTLGVVRHAANDDEEVSLLFEELVGAHDDSTSDDESSIESSLKSECTRQRDNVSGSSLSNGGFSSGSIIHSYVSASSVESSLPDSIAKDTVDLQLTMDLLSPLGHSQLTPFHVECADGTTTIVLQKQFHGAESLTLDLEDARS